MKGSIYIIRSHQTDDVYYGSTTQMLCKRMASHRRDYKCWLDEKADYKTSYEIIKYEDAYIELVEEIEFQNKQELTAREGHHIRENKCVNKVIPGRTKKEYREDNKAEIAEKKKQYYEDNKAEIAEKTRLYREANIEVIAERERLYREANREKCKAYNKQYYASKKLN